MSPEALLAEIANDPDSDQPRRQYADALRERGDPRGELIALQLAQDPDPEQIDALVEQHGVTWLGNLRALTKRAQFRRGFVTRLELFDGIKPNEEQLADPALATIEDLLPGRAHHDQYAKLITSPALKALRRIEIYNSQLVTAFARTPARITHIACSARASDGAEWFERLLRVCESRPEVTSLTCKLWMLRHVVTSPLFERLTSITISKRVNEALLAWPIGGQYRIALAIQSAPALEPCIAEPEPCIGGPESWLGAIEIALSAGQPIARCWGDFGRHVVGAALQYLPSAVKRVEIERGPDTPDLGRAATFFKVEVAVVPPRPRVGYVRALAIRPKPGDRPQPM